VNTNRCHPRYHFCCTVMIVLLETITGHGAKWTVQIEKYIRINIEIVS
jgi:hypothetical protein